MYKRLTYTWPMLELYVLCEIYRRFRSRTS